MKYQFASLLALAGAVSAAPAPAAPAPVILPASAQGPSCVYPIGQHNTPAPKVVGRLFEIDGKVEYFAGTNAWWLGHLNNNSDIDTSLAEIKATGYKVVRVWGFGDVTTLPPTDAPFGTYFHVLNETGSYINYGSNGLQRLDYAVHAAENHGVKLVLNFVNNWGDMGGIGAYNVAFGGNATTWYTDKVSQEVYRNYIKVIVNRYKSSNAIFAWELGNEPRCHGCPSSTIYNWATSISKYIKSLDSTHMVTLGDEGWLAPTTKVAGNDGSYAYSLGEGVDFELNLKIKTLDYGVFHLYPNSWSYNYTWGTEWIEQHDTLGARANKPVILEEYGTPFPYNHTQTEAPWQAAVQKSGIAADQIWQFGSIDLSVDLSSISDVNTIVYGSAEYSTLGTQHAKAMLAKKVPK